MQSVAEAPDVAGTPESELLMAVRSGQTSAYAELFARHQGAAITLARGLVAESDVEDLVDDAFVKVLDQLLRGGGPTTSFRSYLFVTIRNLNVDHYRRRRLQVDNVGPNEYPESAIAVPDISERVTEAATIGSAFARLPVHWRDTLWRTEVLGHSLEEIAHDSNDSQSTVAVRAFRAREGLRQAYLAEHIESTTDPVCVAAAPLVPRYVRGKLGIKDRVRFGHHLRTCVWCQGVTADVTKINRHLRAYFTPLVVAEAVNLKGSWLTSAVVGWKSATVAASISTVVVGAGIVVGTQDNPSPEPAAPRAVPSVTTSSAPSEPPRSTTAVTESTTPTPTSKPTPQPTSAAPTSTPTRTPTRTPSLTKTPSAPTSTQTPRPAPTVSPPSLGQPWVIVR